MTQQTCDPGDVGFEATLTRLSPESRLEVGAAPEMPAEAAPASVGSLRGVWIVNGSSALVSFNVGGAYVWDGPGTLDTAPADSGSFEVPTSSLRLTSRGGTSCRTGDVLIMRNPRTFSSPDVRRTLVADVVGDDCSRLTGRVFLTLVSS